MFLSRETERRRIKVTIAYGAECKAANQGSRSTGTADKGNSRLEEAELHELTRNESRKRNQDRDPSLIVQCASRDL